MFPVLQLHWGLHVVAACTILRILGDKFSLWHQNNAELIIFRLNDPELFMYIFIQVFLNIMGRSLYNNYMYFFYILFIYLSIYFLQNSLFPSARNKMTFSIFNVLVSIETILLKLKCVFFLWFKKMELTVQQISFFLFIYKMTYCKKPASEYFRWNRSVLVILGCLIQQLHVQFASLYHQYNPFGIPLTFRPPWVWSPIFYGYVLSGKRAPFTSVHVEKWTFFHKENVSTGDAKQHG